MNSQARITRFADIMLPVPIPRLFTYRVPQEMNELAAPFLRVIVPFGPSKILTGVIIKVHETAPADYEAKMLLEILDTHPVIFETQISLIRWMAGYYMCTEGEVLNAAIPSGLKLSSESQIQIHPEFDFDQNPERFSEKEWEILYRLRHESLSYPALSKACGTKNLHGILKSLRKKDAVILFEEIREKFQPKKEKRIRFAKTFTSQKKLEQVFKQLEGKAKQEELLLELLRHLPVFNNPDINEGGVSKTLLLEAGHSTSTIKTLTDRGILESIDAVVSRFPEVQADPKAIPVLTETQKSAEHKMLEFFEQGKPVLLNGITGSGKTELYISLIQKVFDSGAQVLFLLPEIALTTQIVLRLRKVFGNQLGIYHSKFSDNERVEVWNGVADGRIRLVIGVRSSVFLPFENLGLIIIDEEHDGSYKQDRAPRYQARDTALMLARIHHAKVVLGSGTPSTDSYFHVKEGHFGMVELTERYGGAQLPEIKLANVSADTKQKKIKGSFTSVLIKAITETLEQNKQVILFQNRRGYAPCIECHDCGQTIQCHNCSVSLTYHQFRNALICHYCGYREQIPKACPSCSSNALRTPGPGTEKLEEEIKLYFPDVSVQRMDYDTTRTKSSHEKILNDFSTGKTKILVGTQMVTKGLDFDHVGLVGVFDADRMMYFPDFRSVERAFQLITQVSGRAGRRADQGQVLIQTRNPENPLFQYIINHQVKPFLETQLEDRMQNNYPPYSRVIEISFRDQDKKISVEAAELFAGQSRKAFPAIQILGPGEPGIGKIRNEFIHTVLFKIPRNHGNLGEIKMKMLRISELMHTDRRFKKLRIIFDVDPI